VSGRTPAGQDDLGAFAGGLAHELSNAVNGIYLNLDLLRVLMQRDDRAASDALLGDALRQCERGVGIIRSLRDFAAAPETLEPSPADVAGITRQAIAETMVRDRSPLALQIEMADSDPVAANCDAPAVCHVLIRLFENAGQAGATRVDVMLGTVGGQATIDVLDNGPGVSPLVADRLFQRFASTRREQGHLGLGLWSARRLCRAQGGDLDFIGGSDPGARFRMTLPMAQGEIRRPEITKNL
jgi:signal transduction histidine kinase